MGVRNKTGIIFISVNLTLSIREQIENPVPTAPIEKLSLKDSPRRKKNNKKNVFKA